MLSGKTGQSLTYPKTTGYTGQFSVRVTDANACVNKTNPLVSVYINALPKPPATASNNGPLCGGGTLNLSCTTQPSFVSYFWTGPSDYSSSVQNPSITGFSALKAGTYTVKSVVNSCYSATGTTTTIASPAVE